ncbi:MAG: ribbon-helix-helix protein, CopG family [Chloroflexota bacterium]
MNVVRTQIQLSEEQAGKLKELAARRGVSMAELVREAVEAILAESNQRDQRRRAIEVIGKFPGPPDLSTNHDAYLAEDYR